MQEEETEGGRGKHYVQRREVCVCGRKMKRTGLKSSRCCIRGRERENANSRLQTEPIILIIFSPLLCRQQVKCAEENLRLSEVGEISGGVE